MSNGITRKDLEKALDHALNKKRMIDNETHFDDHEFIALMKERYKRRQEMVDKFKKSFVGAIAVAFVGFLIWVGQIVIGAVKNGHHP